MSSDSNSNTDSDSDSGSDSDLKIDAEIRKLELKMKLLIKNKENRNELKKCEDKFEILKSKYNDSDITIHIQLRKNLGNCSICLERLDMSSSIINCGHIFHLECINKINRKKCPLCRETFEDVYDFTKFNSKYIGSYYFPSTI